MREREGEIERGERIGKLRSEQVRGAGERGFCDYTPHAGRRTEEGGNMVAMATGTV